MPRLTKEYIERLKYDPTGPETQIVWGNGKHCNLGIGLGARGKTFKGRVLVYTAGEKRGKRTIGTLGKVGELTLDEALALLQDAQRLARTGVNPFEKKKPCDGTAAAAGRPYTVADLLERYWKEHVLTSKKKRSQTRDALLIRHLAAAVLPHRPAAERPPAPPRPRPEPRGGGAANLDEAEAGSQLVLRPPTFLELEASAVTKEDARAIKAAYADQTITFNRMRSLVIHAFNLATREEWTNGGHPIVPEGMNPWLHVPPYKERKIEQIYTAEQSGRLLDLIEEWIAVPRKRRGRTTSAYSLWALLAYYYTGYRYEEILGLARYPLDPSQCPDYLGWVDFEGRKVRFWDTKSGAQERPLNTEAAALFRSIPEVPGNPYYFPGMCAGRPLRAIYATWRAVCAAAGVPRYRIHDFRHLFVTMAVQAGAPLQQAGRAVGHTSEYTTQRYTHLLHEAVAGASEVAARYLNERRRRRTELADPAEPPAVEAHVPQ